MSDDNKKTEHPGLPELPEQPEVVEPIEKVEQPEQLENATQSEQSERLDWHQRLEQLKQAAKLTGATLNKERGRVELWLLGFFGFLGLLLFINLFARPEHPHFGIDAWWGFWAVFGLIVGVAMVFIMKRVIQPLIVRKEDYYGDL